MRVALAMLLALAFSTLEPVGAAAYRPFVSTDAAVADPGEVEAEFGYLGFREKDGRASIVAPTAIGNLGVGRDLEVVAESKLVHDLFPPARRRGERTGPAER